MLKRDLHIPPEHLYPRDDWRIVEVGYSDRHFPRAETAFRQRVPRDMADRARGGRLRAGSHGPDDRQRPGRDDPAALRRRRAALHPDGRATGVLPHTGHGRWDPRALGHDAERYALDEGGPWSSSSGASGGGCWRACRWSWKGRRPPSSGGGAAPPQPAGPSVGAG